MTSLTFTQLGAHIIVHTKAQWATFNHLTAALIQCANLVNIQIQTLDTWCLTTLQRIKIPPYTMWGSEKGSVLCKCPLTARSHKMGKPVTLILTPSCQSTTKNEGNAVCCTFQIFSENSSTTTPYACDARGKGRVHHKHEGFIFMLWNALFFPEV